MTPTAPDQHPVRLNRRHLLTAGLALAATPLLGGIAGCGPIGDTDQARSSLDRLAAGDPGAAPKAIADLSARLVAPLVEPGANLVASPLSVLVALAMARNGAAGDTADEMDTVLGIDDLDSFNAEVNSVCQLLESRSKELRDDREVVVALANSLWGQRDLEFADPFLDALAQYYGAGMSLVDFRSDPDDAIERINDWTKDETHDLIPEIVSPQSVTDDTRLVLVNALYFAAPWTKPFQESSTQDRPFTTGGGEEVMAPTMAGDGKQWYSDDSCQAARVDYDGGDLAMALVLPRKDVASTLESWTSGGLARMLTGWQGEAVKLQVPKWEHEWDATLNETLGKLGMPTAFTDDADFSGMTTQEQLLISTVAHRATITVDEKGTEAAAATAAVAGTTSAPGGKDPKELHLDRPYLYVIHDIDTATPLFVGVVDDPTA